MSMAPGASPHRRISPPAISPVSDFGLTRRSSFAHPRSYDGCDPTHATPTWTSTPPTPPPATLVHRPSSGAARPHSTALSSSNSFPEASSPASAAVKRRASLPLSVLSKPLPPIPTAAAAAASSTTAASESAPDRRQDTSLRNRHRPGFRIRPDVPKKEYADPLGHPSSHDTEDPRQHHALSELLSTEVGYLLDLRILVCVYLRLLPVLTTRSNLTHTHTSSSNLSVAHFSRPLNGSQRTPSSRTSTSTSPFTDCTGPNSPAIPPTKHKDRHSPRHLFSSSDLDTVTRNADQILEFHENLVRELCAAVSQFGFHIKSQDEQRSTHFTDVQRAIDVVSSIFINRAARFDLYQSFCSGHPDAFDLVRNVQQKYSSEWEAFELRCADVAAELSSDASLCSPQGTTSGDRQGSDHAPTVPKKRRHSLSSLDASAHAHTHVVSSFNSKSSNMSTSESGHSDKDTSGRRPRLLFMDYLIKPVQRICKYPLLLTQLQKTSPGKVDAAPHDVVRRAILVMRAVTRSVDEARRQHTLSVKSSLVVSRISQGVSASALTPSQPCQPPLTSVFLSSLGLCRLAGSLDVILYHGSSWGKSTTVKAKYLGAFLFSGGFFILAKVTKPKAYEPRHWFSLRGVELVDSNTDDALLPSWFRLASRGHTFELAASCRREKEIWMDAIRGAVSEEPTWESEPPTSLQADTHLVLEDLPCEVVSPLPTIQSIPELDSDADFSTIGEIQLGSTPYARRGGYRPDYAGKTDTPGLPPSSSRRSSVASFRAYPSESNTFHLVRSTATAREQVDRWLLDVFSEQCLTARLHAHTNEDLFEAQKVTRSFSRSSSGLTMASAMGVAAKNRLTKRESVLVPRRKSCIDAGNCWSDVEGQVPVLNPSTRPAGKRRHPKRLKIVVMAKLASSDGDEDINEVFLDSPSPMPYCSTASATVPAMPLDLPAPLTEPLDSSVARSEFLDVRQEDCVPKRSRSMIDNVRCLFSSRSNSPISPLVREPSVGGVSSPSLLKWWSRGSFRQRARSAPDVPGDELPTSQSLSAPEPQRPSILLAERPHSQPDLKCFHSFSPHLRATGHVRHTSVEFEVGDASPMRVRTLFAAKARRRSTVSVSVRTEATTGTIRVRRNLSFLQRFTPTGMSSPVAS